MISDGKKGEEEGFKERFKGGDRGLWRAQEGGGFISRLSHPEQCTSTKLNLWTSLKMLVLHQPSQVKI